MLKDGLCLESGNFIEIEVIVNDCNEKIGIMNIYDTKLELNDIDLYYNNSIIPLLSIENERVYIKFDKYGTHTILLKIKKTLHTISRMFSNINYVKSTKFLPGFDSSNVYNMIFTFCDMDNIKFIDTKYLDTRNLMYLSYFIDYSSIEFIDISNFNTSKVIEMDSMFYNTKNIKELNLSSFDTSNVRDCNEMSHEINHNCTIIISNKFTKCR